jgi:hypothetical protein
VKNQNNIYEEIKRGFKFSNAYYLLVQNLLFLPVSYQKNLKMIINK